MRFNGAYLLCEIKYTNPYHGFCGECTVLNKISPNTGDWRLGNHGSRRFFVIFDFRSTFVEPKNIFTCSILNFWVFWKATSLNRSFLASKSPGSKLAHHLGPILRENFGKTHNVRLHKWMSNFQIEQMMWPWQCREGFKNLTRPNASKCLI